MRLQLCHTCRVFRPTPPEATVSIMEVWRINHQGTKIAHTLREGVGKIPDVFNITPEVTVLTLYSYSMQSLKEKHR